MTSGVGPIHGPRTVAHLRAPRHLTVVLRFRVLYLCCFSCGIIRLQRVLCSLSAFVGFGGGIPHGMIFTSRNKCSTPVCYLEPTHINRFAWAGSGLLGLPCIIHRLVHLLHNFRTGMR